MNLSRGEIEEARRTHCPRPFPSREWIPSLIVQQSPAGFIISDWAGYLTTVSSTETLRRCVDLEASGQGLLRELITGETATPVEPSDAIPEVQMITLDNLEIEL